MIRTIYISEKKAKMAIEDIFSCPREALNSGTKDKSRIHALVFGIEIQRKKSFVKQVPVTWGNTKVTKSNYY